jgi:hypothetical protein
MIDAPAKVATAAKAPAAQPGIWGQITHGVSSAADAAGHGIADAARAVNGVATNQYVHDVMSFGNVAPDNTGIVGMVSPARASSVAPAQQGIKVNNIRLNQGSPQYDVEAPQAQYPAMPRGLSANGGFGQQSVDASPSRLAIEGPSSVADPLQSMINQPYSAVPHGWSANGGFNGNPNLNPQQFFDQSGNGSASGAGSAAESAASSAVPKGWSANGGWESDLGKVLGDLGDAL